MVCMAQNEDDVIIEAVMKKYNHWNIRTRDVNLLNNLGLEFANTGQYDTALFFFCKASEIDPINNKTQELKKFALEILKERRW